MAMTLRILCLHDAHSCAPDLKKQLGPLGKRLYEQHGIDLVYVNSPIVEVLASASAGDEDDREQRVWYEEVETNHHNNVEKINRDENARSVHYRGLDASLMLVRQIWTSAPFWGIIGVGQGAAVASIFLSLLESDNNNHPIPDVVETGAENDETQEEKAVLPRRQQAPPQLAIFVNGESLVPVDEPILDTTDLSILHLVNENDDVPSSTPRQQERLVRQLPGRVEHRPRIDGSNSTTTPSMDRLDWNVMGRFIVDQKKCLCGIAASQSDDGSNHNPEGAATSNINNQREIVVLQTALHLAEQQAADVIAETIALDPPAALMAVIRPQQVAGWNGNKRREFGAEGGGAPCPSEFLLHRTQRGQNDGMSRVHPSNKQGDGEAGAPPAEGTETNA